MGFFLWARYPCIPTIRKLSVKFEILGRVQGFCSDLCYTDVVLLDASPLDMRVVQEYQDACVTPGKRKNL